MKEMNSNCKARRVTSATVADFCQVSRSTVQNWIKLGRLKAFKLPSGHYRIRRADFLSFLLKYDIPVPEESSHMKGGEK